ncbi:MAG: DegV family protein [Clostridia bacterium]|nr:DegV family protein [Clostridia bacterium]MEE1024738.1 DegV family protein [Acutalibacteraceae bacterium]
MSKIALITDSASDISILDAERYNIDVIPFKFTIDGESFLGTELVDEALYEKMEAAEGIPTTSQITMFDFSQLFEKYAADGYTDLIVTLINSEGSATYNNAVFAAEKFKENNSDINIYCIDSKGYTGMYGYAVIEGAKMRNNGENADKIVEFIKGWLDKTAVYFGLYTLKFARKSGRIPSAAAFVGDALGLKPIMRICDHKIVTHDKTRGDKNVIPAIIKHTMATADTNADYCVVYGSDIELRDEIIEKATEAFGKEPAYSFRIGAAIAANAGPKVVGLIVSEK